MYTAGRLYLAIRFVWGALFWLMATVFMIYQIEVVGLNALQLVLIGTALELGAFIFEVPTGVVADSWSRKGSVVVGYFITGISFVWMGLAPDFWHLLAASLLWGLGWTFISGAQEAWLADEVGESEAATLYLRGSRLQYIGGFGGILLAVLIAQIELYLPIVVAGIGFLMTSLSLTILMRETRVPTQSSEVTTPLQTFREGVGVIRGSSTLILLMVVGVVFGAFSEGYDRLSSAHLLRDFPFESVTGIPIVVTFGVMTALGILLSIVAVAIAERHVDTDSARALGVSLAVISALIMVAVLWFALTGHVWVAICLYVFLAPLRALVDPLTLAWVNRNLPSSSRATVISMHSQADALGQIGGGPGVGLLGRETSIRFAISCAALLLSPALWLYLRAAGQQTSQD